MIHYASYPCPFGFLRIGWENDAVFSVDCAMSAGESDVPSPVSDLAAAQFQQYFEGTRKEFDFPVHVSGTPFQMRVWDHLRAIPYGQTRSYKQIACEIGSPGASRAVGMACNRNPIWIAIPCHRVVGSNRSLTGYAGGLEMKQQLLSLEQHNPGR